MGAMWWFLHLTKFQQISSESWKMQSNTILIIWSFSIFVMTGSHFSQISCFLKRNPCLWWSLLSYYAMVKNSIFFHRRHGCLYELATYYSQLRPNFEYFDICSIINEHHCITLTLRQLKIKLKKNILQEKEMFLKKI